MTLSNTRFTMIPSIHVKPPTIEECPQIAERVAEEIVRLDKSSGIVIAKIKALVFDEELIEMGREDRIRKMNLPIGLGDENRQDYFHTTLGHMSLQALMTIPPMVRNMVTDQTEAYCRSKGDNKVSHARFKAYAEEQGMTPELMERFQKKKKSG